MVLTGVLRPGSTRIRVRGIGWAINHYVDRDCLHEVSRESDGRVYLRAFDEFDRHCVVLRLLEQARIDCIGFRPEKHVAISQLACGPRLVSSLMKSSTSLHPTRALSTLLTPHRPWTYGGRPRYVRINLRTRSRGMRGGGATWSVGGDERPANRARRLIRKGHRLGQGT